MEQTNFANMENKENPPFVNQISSKSTNFVKSTQCDANMSSENKGSSIVSMISTNSNGSSMSLCNKSQSNSTFKVQAMQDMRVLNPNVPALASKLRRMSIDQDQGSQIIDSSQSFVGQLNQNVGSPCFFKGHQKTQLAQ